MKIRFAIIEFDHFLLRTHIRKFIFPFLVGGISSLILVAFILETFGRPHDEALFPIFSFDPGGKSAEWFGALGGWVGGIGAFYAAHMALRINNEQRQQTLKSHKTMCRKFIIELETRILRIKKIKEDFYNLHESYLNLQKEGRIVGQDGRTTNDYIALLHIAEALQDLLNKIILEIKAMDVRGTSKELIKIDSQIFWSIYELSFNVDRIINHDFGIDVSDIQINRYPTSDIETIISHCTLTKALIHRGTPSNE